MDGSASRLFICCNLVVSKSNLYQNNLFGLKKKIRVEDGDKWAEFAPYHRGFRMDLQIDFRHPVFDKQNQHLVLDFSGSKFAKEISRARTFGFMKDIEYLHSQNLALGGSLTTQLC